MYHAPLKQPQKLIPFETKYRDKRFAHVPQGIINPVHVFKDPRRPSPKVDIAIDSSKVVLKPPPIEKAAKTKAFIPEDLRTPFIYIKQLVGKEKKRKEKTGFWNKSGNVTSLRVDKSVTKNQITDMMALSIPEINEDIASFLKNFLKNLHRLIKMKLYFDISQSNLSFPDLYQGFCKIKRLKQAAKGQMLVNERQFIDFFKMLGWEKANFPSEELESFFQLAKIDDKNVFFQHETGEKTQKIIDLRQKSLENRKNLKESDLVESKKFEEDEIKRTAASKKQEPMLSIKALIYNFEKFMQEKARIKSLTSLQSSLARAEILRNLIEEFSKKYKDSKIFMKMELHSRTCFMLLRNASDIPYVTKFDKLRGFYEDLSFEKATVMNFLKGKHLPDDMHPDIMIKMLEQLQKKEEEELKIMGDFVQDFKKEKQHFKESDFTLLEIVDFIYERKYSRKDFDLLTKLIKKLKRMYNYSQKRLPDDEIKPKHHIDLSFLGQSLNGICHKVYLSSEILSNFIENLNTLILRNVEHFKPKNPEIHKALIHNLSLDFTIKYIGNLSQKIERISSNFNNLYSQIEESPELITFLEEKTYFPDPNFRDSLKATTPTALQNSGGLSFGPGLFQKAKQNTKMQRVMKILTDNFLELTEEFNLGILMPTPNQAVNKIKGHPNMMDPNSPEITITDENDEYYSNIKRQVGEKNQGLNSLSPNEHAEGGRFLERGATLKKNNNLMGKALERGELTNTNSNKLRLPTAGFSSPQMEAGDDDDQVIDILNPRKHDEKGNFFEKKHENIGERKLKREEQEGGINNFRKHEIGEEKQMWRGDEISNKHLREDLNFREDRNEVKTLSLARSKGFKEEKKEKPMKIIKKNFIEIPDLLDPYSMKHSLELYKIRPYSEKFAFAEFDIGPHKERMETDDDNLKNLGHEQLDFKSTTKSFFVGEKADAFGKDQSKKEFQQSKKTQFFDQTKKTIDKTDKMSEINKWMEPTIAKTEAEKAKKAESIMKPNEENEELNLSQILLQAKQKKDTLKESSHHEKHEGANRLEDTLNQSYYKPEAVEIGKYSVKSDLFREYELYLPVDYYTKFTKNEEKDQEPKWYVRPHHIETVTEHPLSYKDNILDTKYQSWLEPMEKQMNPIEQKEREKKEKKEELISDLEKRLQKLKEEVDLKKASEMFAKNPTGSFMDSPGLKTTENYYDSVRDHKNQQLMTSSYETMLHELRKEEKNMLNKKRGEFSTDVGAPEEKWWEKKGKEFSRELKKYDLLNYKPPSGHSEYVNKLQIKELY